MKQLSTLWFIVALLVQHSATSVVCTRPPCQELPSNLKGAETYELRPKDGYFTLVDHGSTGAEFGEHCNENFKAVHPMDSESERAKGRGLPHVVIGSNSKDTLQSQQLQWPETETKKQEQGGGGSRRVSKPDKLGDEASKDVVVTLEEKPLRMEQEKEREKERLVVLDDGEKKRGDGDDDGVPAYVLVRAPKMELVSKSQDQMVTISLETLNGLIKGSLFPPSGPNMAHNWYMADLPEHNIYKDPVAVADQMLLVRVVPADKNMLDDASAAAAADADALPGFQELPDGTFRIKD